MDRAEPAQPHQLRDAAGVVAVGLRVQRPASFGWLQIFGCYPPFSSQSGLDLLQFAVKKILLRSGLFELGFDARLLFG
jgi:hypothetical protein